MIRVLILTLAAGLSFSAQAFTCNCSLTFTADDGYMYNESVSVSCPSAASPMHLDCGGYESGGAITSTCSNAYTGESKSATGQRNYGTSGGSPSCSLR